jgi:hypothetical protein
MNKLNLPGTNVAEHAKCQEKRLTFKQVTKLLEDSSLLTPPYQTDIDQEKVEQMVESYLAHPEYLIYKNKIVIAVVTDNSDDSLKLYVLDGQHRLEMARILYEEHDFVDYLNFCYFRVDTNKEAKRLFKEINRDSCKNAKYVSLDEFKESTYISLKKYLHEKYSHYFSVKKSTLNKRYSLSEFVDKLVEVGYIEQFENISDLITDLEVKNKKFNKLVDYQEYYLESPDMFYKDELGNVKDGKIFSLSNNNFIDFLQDSDTVPDHKFKNIKKNISPKTRLSVWANYYGDLESSPCPFAKYGCDNKISRGKNGFHCGHVISEHNQGETSIENLRPICFNCNSLMGTTNWPEYEKKVKRIFRKNNNKLKCEVSIDI